MQYSDLTISTSLLLQDLENKVKFFMLEENGSGPNENCRVRYGQSRQPFLSFHGESKGVAVNSTCKQITSTKMSREPLEYAYLFEI